MQLLVQRGYELGRVYRVNAPKLVIGSEPSVLIPINDTAVAPYHAGLSVNKGAIFIEDFNTSSTGTFVNNSRIMQPTMLKPGDYIQLGNTVLSLQPENVNLRPDRLAGPEFQNGGLPQRPNNQAPNSRANQVVDRPGNVGGFALATPQAEQKLGHIKIGNKLQLVGIEDLTPGELHRELEQGARFVIFTYAISAFIISYKRNSSCIFLKSGQGAFSKSWKYNLLTFLAGWWGFPWGPIFTIDALVTNLKGGKDLTSQVRSALRL